VIVKPLVIKNHLWRVLKAFGISWKIRKLGMGGEKNLATPLGCSHAKGDHVQGKTLGVVHNIPCVFKCPKILRSCPIATPRNCLGTFLSMPWLINEVSIQFDDAISWKECPLAVKHGAMIFQRPLIGAVHIAMFDCRRVEKVNISDVF
jgi:hypothetical protein